MKLGQLYKLLCIFWKCLVKSLFGLGVLSLFMTGSYGKLKATFPMLSKSLFINYFETYSKTQLSSTCVSSSFDKIVILKFIWESDSVTHWYLLVLWFDPASSVCMIQDFIDVHGPKRQKPKQCLLSAQPAGQQLGKSELCQANCLSVAMFTHLFHWKLHTVIPSKQVHQRDIAVVLLSVVNPLTIVFSAWYKTSLMYMVLKDKNQNSVCCQHSQQGNNWVRVNFAKQIVSQ